MEKAMAPHSSTLAWKIPWTEEPGELQSTGSLGVRQDWATSLSLFTFMHWRRKWQPNPVFLPGESQGRWSLVGCCLWGPQLKRRSSSSSSSSSSTPSVKSGVISCPQLILSTRPQSQAHSCLITIYWVNECWGLLSDDLENSNRTNMEHYMVIQRCLLCWISEEILN